MIANYAVAIFMMGIWQPKGEIMDQEVLYTWVLILHTHGFVLM